MSILETIVALKLTEVAARKAELPLAVLHEQLAEAHSRATSWQPFCRRRVLPLA